MRRENVVNRSFERRDGDATRKLPDVKRKQGFAEGTSERQSEATLMRAEREKDVKIAKRMNDDDIEAYLTTFERLIKAYDVKKDHWTYRLTPHLTGEAQQAYVAMATADVDDYDKVKAAILKQYDVTEESYADIFEPPRRECQGACSEVGRSPIEVAEEVQNSQGGQRQAYHGAVTEDLTRGSTGPET